MKKIAYTLGLTMLCSLPVWAQETVDIAVSTEQVPQNAQIKAPIDPAAAAAISEAVDDLIKDKPQAASPTQVPEEEQTIFFSEDLLDEVDDELKAPIFTKDNEEQKPTTAIVPSVPEVKIPANIKTPQAKTIPSSEDKSLASKTQSQETAQPILSIDEDIIDLGINATEERKEAVATPNTEKSSHPIQPSAENAESTSKVLPSVEDGQTEPTEVSAVEPVLEPETQELPVEIGSMQVNDEATTPALEQKQNEESGPTKTTETIQDSVSQDAEVMPSPALTMSSPTIVNKVAEEKAPTNETLMQSEGETTAIEEVIEASENEVIDDNPTPHTELKPEPEGNQPNPTIQPQTDNAVESAQKSISKEFSLNETAVVPQPKKNAFSLDDNVPLPANVLKNDALSPSILNRGLINISPEQRAKMMMKKKYDEMDTNQDGVVSEEEFVEYKTQEARKIAHQVFNQIDRNGDKSLSEYEYGILMNKMIENYIKQPRKKAN